MTIRRAIPNLVVEDTEAAKAFFNGFLGFEIAMDEAGFVMYRSPSNSTAQITTADLKVEGQDRGIKDANVSVEVEDAARELGYARVRLDTAATMDVARKLYGDAGYEEIADYNGNSYAVFWGEKRL